MWHVKIQKYCYSFMVLVFKLAFATLSHFDISETREDNHYLENDSKEIDRGCDTQQMYKTGTECAAILIISMMYGGQPLEIVTGFPGIESHNIILAVAQTFAFVYLICIL